LQNQQQLQQQPILLQNQQPNLPQNFQLIKPDQQLTLGKYVKPVWYFPLTTTCQNY
jgi:hypothetical protein